MRILSLCVSLVLAVSCARGQGFINLNFESGLSGTSSSDYAIPGWTTSFSPSTYYGSPHLGFTPYFLLVSSNSPTYNPGTQLAGRYSLAMKSGRASSFDPPNSPWVDAYISQTGDIPSSALSIRLLAAPGPSNGSLPPPVLRVFVGGVQIPMFSLGGNSYGGNIASFAGSTSELRIVNGNPVNNFGELMVDNIVFSPTAIPEPSSASLLVLGAIAILAGKRTRSSS